MIDGCADTTLILAYENHYSQAGRIGRARLGQNGRFRAAVLPFVDRR